MDTSWISSATSGMLNYVYNSITGDGESVATHRTRNATICKGMVVTDLPTNNYEPLEVSHARAMAKKYNREKELEEKIAVLKAQCNAKSNENARLQDKVAEGMKKEDDLTRKLEEKEKLIKRAKKCIFVTKEKLNKKEEELQELNKELSSVKDSLTNQSKANESLASQIKDLKSVLVRREENHKKQQLLIRSLAEDAKSKLETANFYRSTMNNELNLSKGRERNLKEEKASLKKHVEVLERALEEKTKQDNERDLQTTQLQTMTNLLKKAENIIKEIKEKHCCELAVIKNELTSSREREIYLQTMDVFVNEQLRDLKVDLERMTKGTNDESHSITFRADSDKSLEKPRPAVMSAAEEAKPLPRPSSHVILVSDPPAPTVTQTNENLNNPPNVIINVSTSCENGG
ncbi:hypothetical protein ABFA07_002131 [Porites harrisoni]